MPLAGNQCSVPDRRDERMPLARGHWEYRLPAFPSGDDQKTSVQNCGGVGGVHSLRKTTLRSLIQSRNGIGYAVAFLPFLMLGETLCDDVNQFSYKNASLFICFFCFLFAFFGLSSYGLCTQNTFKGS